jgi:hypothetical protein
MPIKRMHRTPRERQGLQSAFTGAGSVSQDVGRNRTRMKRIVAIVLIVGFIVWAIVDEIREFRANFL